MKLECEQWRGKVSSNLWRSETCGVMFVKQWDLPIKLSPLATNLPLDSDVGVSSYSPGPMEDISFF